MKHVSIKEAKDRLPALVREAETGERIVVTRRGKPVAELVASRTGGLNFEAMRRYKIQQGLPKRVVTWVSPDFDAPLPEDFLITPGAG